MINPLNLIIIRSRERKKFCKKIRQRVLFIPSRTNSDFWCFLTLPVRKIFSCQASPECCEFWCWHFQILSHLPHVKVSHNALTMQLWCQNRLRSQTGDMPGRGQRIKCKRIQLKATSHGPLNIHGCNYIKVQMCANCAKHFRTILDLLQMYHFLGIFEKWRSGRGTGQYKRVIVRNVIKCYLLLELSLRIFLGGARGHITNFRGLRNR